MSRSRSRLLAAGALAVGVVMAGMPTGSPAVGESLSCRGHAATIVGKPGKPIGGTNARDVIVTNGASDVYARGGDDLICVTNIAGPSVEDRVTISAGDGRDTIDTTATHGVGSSAYLGAGDDTYIGGSNRDWVEAADPWSETSPAEGTDSIDTGGGPDYVLTGGTPAVPDGDSIDLGPGADQIEVIGALAPTSWAAGTGSDLLTVARLTPRGTWVFDNAAGRASRNGSTVLSWTSFERFELNHSRNSTVSFTGGPRAEHVRSLVALDRASLGEGNDTLEIWPERLADAAAMSIAGQGGNDLLRLGRGYNDGNVDLDLAAGTVRFVRPTQAGRTSRVTGFERTHVYAMWARVLGTTGDDRIGWDACHGSVSGRAGDDALTYLPIQEDSCGYMGDAATIRIYGGRGNDQLRGGFMPDVLLGGSGRDTADGRAGRDLCRVESARRCERP